MNESSTKLAQRLPPGLARKIIWIVLGVAVFFLAYLAGAYLAPIVSALVHLITTVFKLFGRLLP